MVKQLLNSAIAKYRDLSVARRATRRDTRRDIICSPLINHDILLSLVQYNCLLFQQIGK